MKGTPTRYCCLIPFRVFALLAIVLALSSLNTPAYAQCTSPSGADGDKEWFAGSGGSFDCATAGGATVGGSCWFYGAVNESCDTVCTGVSAVYDDATLTYAGSGGTNANCQAVLDAIGGDGSGLPGSGTDGLAGGGCTYYIQGSGGRLRNTIATTSSAADSVSKRACACKDGGVTAGTYKFCIGSTWVPVVEDSALTGCTTEADWDWDPVEKAFKQCDGANWQKVTCASGNGGTCLDGTDGFTQVASTPEPKRAPAAAALGDGRVLFCGGFNNIAPTYQSNRCDIYDPSADSFTQVANLPQIKEGAAAASLADGRVLICGGWYSGPSYKNRCDIYDPSANSFTQVANLPQAKTNISVAPLADGRVLFCGGNGGSYTNRCDIYDPSANNFTQVANLPQAKSGAVAAPLADGRVLICGGSTGSITDRCDIYDPSANSFTQVASVPGPRAPYTAAPLADGRVLLCGGNDGSTTYFVRCDIYDPDADSYTQVSDFPITTGANAAVPLQDGRVLFCGGQYFFTIYDRCDIYTPQCTGGGGSCTSLGACITEGQIEYSGGVMMYCDGTDWYSLAQ